MTPTLAITNQIVTASDTVAHYWKVVAIAFVVSLALTPVMRALALRFGIVDHPDKLRKHHGHPTAYLGGIAMYLGWVAAIVFSFFIVPHNYEELRATGIALPGIMFPLGVFGGALIMTVAGFLDDAYKVSPRVKIGAQLIVAGVVALDHDLGANLAREMLRTMSLGGVSPGIAYYLGAALVALFIIGGSNSMNLLDGMDGLCAGVVAIASVGYLFLAVHATYSAQDPDLAGSDRVQDSVRIVMALAMLGAALGFLPWNFNPAKIFMGDAGSLLLGYLCMTTTLMFSYTGARQMGFVIAALYCFGVPIADTLMAIIRRLMKRQKVWDPDRFHLHHQLRHAGLSVRQTALALYALELAFVAAGCGMVYFKFRIRYMCVITLGVLVLIVIASVITTRRQIAHGKARPA